MKRGSHIQVVSGRLFDPLNPDPDLIDIRDVAHALSNICRFGGHSERYYSVAEHSVHVSYACAPTDALWGLLHDAPEFGLGDMCSPLKYSEFGREFVQAEERLMQVFIDKYGLGPVQPSSVSRADKAMLGREREALLPTEIRETLDYWGEWRTHLDPDFELPDFCVPHCWSPELARVIFLDRFQDLQATRGS